jgi:uncharacterized phage infection (PIP) family protein YhgE
MQAMKVKKNRAKILLIALGCVLAVGACGLAAAAQSYLSGTRASLDELWSTDQEAAAQVEITDAWLDGLLNGELTLDELGSTDADAEQPAPDAEQPEGEATSSETSTGMAAPENGTASAGATTPADADASNAIQEVESWKQEIKAQLQRLYAVKARANSGLNQCIEGAKAEYKALPESEQTQAKKISICLSKAGQLRALQSSCDKEVNAIVDEMRKVLEQNGQSTELADSALAMYKSEKEAMYAELLGKLYS